MEEFIEQEKDPFEILIGGSPPENPADSQKSFSMNFWNTCRWKSEKVATTIHACCGNRNEVVHCHNCLKLNILQLTPQICSNNCPAYEAK